jgi:hypothetical protein
MNKTVNFCGNCPFFNTEYDDYAVGLDTTNTCCLAYNLKQEDYIVSFDNSHDYSEIEPINNCTEKFGSPEWCPLKKDEYTFSFKPFSENRISKINSISDSIDELNDFLDSTNDCDSPEFVEKMKQSAELHDKMRELLNNEETPFNESFQTEINKSVDEIKEQMKLIENATIQLHDTLSKLGNENI